MRILGVTFLTADRAISTQQIRAMAERAIIFENSDGLQTMVLRVFPGCGMGIGGVTMSARRPA